MAHQLAIRRFEEQLEVVGFDLAEIASACLEIDRQPNIVEGWHGGGPGKGHHVIFKANVVTKNLRIYERTRTVFVAPHDMKRERKRHPSGWNE